MNLSTHEHKDRIDSELSSGDKLSVKEELICTVCGGLILLFVWAAAMAAYLE